MEGNPTLLHALPVRERPAQRLLDHRKSLSLMELLALQVGGSDQMEIARQILLQHGDHIRNLTMDDLLAIKGIGRDRGNRILSAIELGVRLCSAVDEERPLVGSPAAAASLVQYDMAALEQEQLRTILLDTRNRLIRVCEIYRGSLTTALVRVGEVFREAIKANASGLIVVHNHPSGDPSPSAEDIALTCILVDSGKMLDIPLLDHLIIGRGRFISLREKGLGFSGVKAQAPSM
jgi:DNA repair protein RadC